MVPDLHRYIPYAWIAVIVVWVVGAFNTKRSMRRQPWSSRLLQIGVVLVAVAVLQRALRYFPWLRPWLLGRFVPRTPAIAWTGLVLTYAGAAIMIAARVYLGRNWSGVVTIKQDHTLICGGPYAVVRHPIYSGLLLAGVGTVLALGQIRGLLVLLLALVVLLQKIRLEEDYMTEQFRGEYLTYQRKVKALIPFVW